jgi:hypothetical protein
MQLLEIFTLKIETVSAKLEIATVQANVTDFISVGLACIARVNVLQNFIVFLEILFL